MLPPRCAAARRAAVAAVRLLVAICLLGSPGAATRADAEPAPGPSGAGTCATADECFARMAAAQRGVQSIAARFRQTKRVALLREPLVSTGTFTFLRPDRVRWEVISPEALVVVIDGAGIRAGPPGSVRPVAGGDAPDAFRDLAGLFTGTDEYAGSRFTVSGGSDPTRAFVLTPRDPTVARVISAIEIEIDPQDATPRRAIIRETNGDTTEIELSDVVLNQPVDPGIFG